MCLQNVCTAREVPRNVHSLNSAHVFILDLGVKFYVWCGKELSDPGVAIEALQFVQKLKVCGYVGKKRRVNSESVLSFPISLLVQRQRWACLANSRCFVCINWYNNVIGGFSFRPHWQSVPTIRSLFLTVGNEELSEKFMHNLSHDVLDEKEEEDTYDSDFIPCTMRQGHVTKCDWHVFGSN